MGCFINSYPQELVILELVGLKLSKIVKELPSEKSVVITKNGRPCAVLFPVREETDLENMLLA